MHAVLHPDVWRGRQGRHSLAAMATGHPGLDCVLPGGGWPTAALTELLPRRPGLGELGLLMPVLASITGDGRSVVLVDPPWVPYPPAMCGHGVDLRHMLLVRTETPGEALWACEQALRGAPAGAVLAWPRACGFTQLRRLQLAARAGRQTGFLFRPADTAGRASPAALRVLLEADDHGLHLTILKARGIRPGTTVRLRRQHGHPPAPGLHVGVAPGAAAPACRGESVAAKPVRTQERKSDRNRPTPAGLIARGH